MKLLVAIAIALALALTFAGPALQRAIENVAAISDC